MDGNSHDLLNMLSAARGLIADVDPDMNSHEAEYARGMAELICHTVDGVHPDDKELIIELITSSPTT